MSTTNYKSVFENLIEEGRNLYKVQKWDRSLEKLSKAKEIATMNNYQRGISLSYSHIGHLYRDKGEWDKAENYYFDNLNFNKKIGNEKQISIAYNTIGNLHRYKGEWNKSLECYQNAISIAQKMGDKRQEKICIDIIGELYKEMGDFKTARKYYEEGYSLAQNQEEICISLNLLGNLYLNLAEWDEALKMYMHSLNLAREMGNEKQISISYNALGNLYSSKGELDLALYYYKSSLELKKDDIGRFICYNNLGNVCFKRREFEAAKKYFLKSTDIINGLEKDSLVSLMIPIRKNMGDFQNLTNPIYFKIENLEKTSLIDGDFNSVIKASNIIAEYANKIGAKSLETIIYRKLGDTFFKKYKFSNKNQESSENDLLMAESYYAKALSNSVTLKMNFQKALALKGFGFLTAEKGDYIKSKSYFYQSIHLLEELGAVSEKQKTQFKYIMIFYKEREDDVEFEKEIISFTNELYKCKNNKLLTKIYLLLGDISIKKGLYKYYLNSLTASQIDQYMFIDTCYDLIFRMKKMNPTLLRKFILEIKAENKELYFGIFLDALEKKLDGHSDDVRNLPTFLKLELNDFEINTSHYKMK